MVEKPKLTTSQLRKIKKRKIELRLRRIIHKHWINKAMTDHIHLY